MMQKESSGVQPSRRIRYLVLFSLLSGEGVMEDLDKHTTLNEPPVEFAQESLI